MTATFETPVAGLPTRPATVTDWKARGLCAQTDPDAFFPEKGGATRDAKAVCAACEVRVQCLEYALDRDERFGIWGGTSEFERKKLRKGGKAPVSSAVPEQPALPRPPHKGGTPPAPCGTETAFRRHRRNKEPVDSACTAAHLVYLDDTREARRTYRKRSRAKARTLARQATA